MKAGWMMAAAVAACCISSALGSMNAVDKERLRPMLTSEWLGRKAGAGREIQDMFHRHRFSSAFQRGAALGSSMLTEAVEEDALTPPPFTVVPPFTIATTKGDVEVAPGEDAAYLFALYHNDNFTDTLWFNSSLAEAFSDLPPKSHLIFAAKSEEGAAKVAELEDRCKEVEGFDKVEDRVHFIAEALSVECTEEEFPHCPLDEDMGDGLGTMLQAFASWGSFESRCSASWGEEGTEKEKHLDCVQARDWLPSVHEVAEEEEKGITAELAVWGSEACDSLPPKMDVKDKIAVIKRGTCSFFQKVSAASAHGARAVLISSPEDADLGRMGCSAPDACKDAKLQIPAAMVSAASLHAAEAAALKGDKVTLHLGSALRSERVIGLDHKARLREVGALALRKGRGMASVVKEAEAYAYEAGLASQLEEEDGKVVLNMAAPGAVFSGAQPLKGQAEFPDEEAMWEFNKMEVYLELQCPKLMDKSCGAWDYPVSLNLCKPQSNVQSEPDCTLQVARWVTAYGRRGEWLTDATALLPFVRHGGAREFVLKQPAFSTQEYLATVKLVLSKTDAAHTPLHTTVLFQGGVFDAQYNARHTPVEVSVHGGAVRVEIEAAVSGHGWGTDSLDCAEFCVTQHQFKARPAVRVDGELFVAKEEARRLYALAGAGSEEGCAEQVEHGVTPNQYGTWETGRAGWCPGGAVKVWRGDVSSVLHGGLQGVLSYEGLVEGKPYQPKPCHGDQCSSEGFAPEIRMQALLVVYGQRLAADDEEENAEGEGAKQEGGKLYPNGRPGGTAHTMKGKQVRGKPIVALEVGVVERRAGGGGVEQMAVCLLAGAVLAMVGTVWSRARARGYWELRR